MKLNEFIKELRDYIGTVDATYVLGSKKGLFTEVLSLVEHDATLCEANKEPTPLTPTGMKPILDTLKHLLTILNEQVVSAEASKFMEDYSTLLYNHNKNTSNNDEVNLLTQTVNRFATLRMTTVELLQNLKSMVKITRDLRNVSFQPTQLSKHYLASFDNKLNK